MPNQTVNPPTPTHTQGPPVPATPQGATMPVETDGPSRTEKVMALVIAILCGTVGALLAFLITRHLEATSLVAVGSSGLSFLGVTGLVRYIEEKLGVL
ncbi:hypothetical protein OG444_04095 [Streptomyces sp. NBC_01232]|uniref:hypothetical protein n=1 Tax=Streptomyces sp. NBC_01232 TaxID=2903786 RepID=UPI002E12B814|nr:hypothetical protein OG444_04095 [Streptomyces sp. NBC_01232]